MLFQYLFPVSGAASTGKMSLENKAHHTPSTITSGLFLVVTRESHSVTSLIFPSLKLSSQLADVKVCVLSNVIKSVTQSPQPVNIIFVSDTWQEIEVNRFKTLPSQMMRLKPLAIINPLELWAPKDCYRDIS